MPRGKYVIWDDHKDAWVGPKGPDEEKGFSHVDEWKDARKFDTVVQAVVMARLLGLDLFMVCHASLEKVYFLQTPTKTHWMVVPHPLQKSSKTPDNNTLWRED